MTENKEQHFLYIVIADSILSMYIVYHGWFTFSVENVTISFHSMHIRQLLSGYFGSVSSFLGVVVVCIAFKPIETELRAKQANMYITLGSANMDIYLFN